MFEPFFLLCKPILINSSNVLHSCNAFCKPPNWNDHKWCSWTQWISRSDSIFFASNWIWKHEAEERAILKPIYLVYWFISTTNFNRNISEMGGNCSIFWFESNISKSPLKQPNTSHKRYWNDIHLFAVCMLFIFWYVWLRIFGEC